MKIEYFNLLKQFIFSWQFLVVVFIIVTKKGWIELIKGLRVKYKKQNLDVSANQEQDENNLSSEEEVQNTQKVLENLREKEGEIEKKNRDIEEQKSLITELFGIVEFYEFSFLNYYFVYNTKMALFWISTSGNTTRDLFLKAYPLPPELKIENEELEKESILNALLTYRLIEMTDTNQLCITEKGKRY